MKDEYGKKGLAPRKAVAKEDITLTNPADEVTPTYAVESEEGPEQQSELPDQWISIAAYYIWKGEGEPEGRDAEYWERARADLMRLQKEGILSTGPQRLDEER